MRDKIPVPPIRGLTVRQSERRYICGSLQRAPDFGRRFAPATKQIGAVAQQADNDVSRGVLFLRLHLHLIERLEQEGACPGPRRGT